MKPAICTACQSEFICEATLDHKAHGLMWFCVACSTYMDCDGQPATADRSAILDSIATRLEAAHTRFGTDDCGRGDIIRHGGTL